jgi:hypothetical protein
MNVDLDVVFIHRVFKMATVAIVTNQILKYKNDPNISRTRSSNV